MEKYLTNQSFSCRSFFQSISLESDLTIAIYVYFQFRNATCKNFPSYSCVDNGSDLEIFESGTYNLLEVTHKFPMLRKVESNIFSLLRHFFILLKEDCKLFLCSVTQRPLLYFSNMYLLR